MDQTPTVTGQVDDAEGMTMLRAECPHCSHSDMYGKSVSSDTTEVVCTSCGQGFRIEIAQ